MTHLEQELQNLKNDTIEMMNLVLNQFQKTQVALVDFNLDIVREVKHLEKRVDAFELKISMDCENALALFNPVAIDLRFILAVLKMVTSVERLGDYAKSMTSTIGKFQRPVNQELLDKTQVKKMFEICSKMLGCVQVAFDTDNSNLARQPLSLDDELDAINDSAEPVLVQWMKDHPDDIENALHLLLIIRRLERFGDQVKNIAHEIIFHHEAKMLKHHKKQIKNIKDGLGRETEGGVAP